jgi:cytochrome c biogenesis protein CcdA/thiol-disulfide isomerase/thioredoxin
MALFFVSLLAGALTVLAPCILPLLPVVIGAGASGRHKSTPYVVVGSLGLSIILFTYLLKASTALISIPPEVWSYISGGILLLFGLTLIFPSLWEKVPGLSRLSARSNRLVGTGYQKKNFWGDVTIGAALGPVFSTCSPTYFVILATVLPASFALGTLYLLAYVLGLSIVLLLIAKLGQRFTGRLNKLADSRGRAKKIIGVIFAILGLMIVTGYEKKLETAILDGGFFDITKVEQKLLQKIDPMEMDRSDNEAAEGVPFTEIVDPAGFVNTDDQITIGQFVGQDIILIDFMTYSCINCQRTFPYLNAWYDEYHDEGLQIIGIHTPEFAFEHEIDNVRAAAAEFGLKFPLVLDNAYATWRAYGNRYWPRKYLIDIHGNVVYDHIGEGSYEETEEKIRELLEERADVLNIRADISRGLASDAVAGIRSLSKSPETYFGSNRNEYFVNGPVGQSGQVTLASPDTLQKNGLYLSGTWNIQPEYAESVEGSVVTYQYQAKEVYIVAEADELSRMEIWQDGQRVSPSDVGGADVNASGVVEVEGSRLYRLIANPKAGEHTLEIRLLDTDIRLFAFTFG